MNKNGMNEDMTTPPHRIQWYSIKSTGDIPLKICFSRRCRKLPVNPFCKSLALLNKADFAVEFRIKSYSVSTRLTELLKFGLLRNKVRLIENNPTATAFCCARQTFELVALSQQFCGIW